MITEKADKLAKYFVICTSKTEGRKNVVQHFDSGNLFSMVFQDIAEFVMIESL